MVETIAVFLPCEANSLTCGDDRLPVGEAERRVGLHDVVVGDALGVQEGAQDLVGRARVDVVGAEQHEPRGAAAGLAHQVFDGRDRLLVRRRPGVEDVLRALLALVLDRVEQKAVQLLEHRQHRLARHRGPAAEHDVDLVFLEQLARLLGEQRPVGGRIDHHRLDLAAEQAALGVEVVDQHQDHVLERGLADRHRARERMQDADLDRPLVRRLGAGRAAPPAPQPAAPANAVRRTPLITAPTIGFPPPSSRRDGPCSFRARDPQAARRTSDQDQTVGSRSGSPATSALRRAAKAP